jgi:hypothetical protein
VGLAALTARRADLGVIFHSIAACRCLKQVIFLPPSGRLFAAQPNGAWSYPQASGSAIKILGSNSTRWQRCRSKQADIRPCTACRRRRRRRRRREDGDGDGQGKGRLMSVG